MNAASIRQMLQRLREEKGMSQSELAKKLPYTASRISRLESGEIATSIEEAQQYAQAVESERATAFATYLGWTWQALEQPSFEHPSLVALRKAEEALCGIDRLRDDPEIKNAFLKEVESCRKALERAAKFLSSTEHSVVFIGGISVGKTSAICALGDLRNDSKGDLQAQMVMPTSSGRTTACEVHVRTGGEYAIAIEPCSQHELDSQVSDFCDHLLSIANGDKPNREGGCSVEMARVLTNMTQLKFDKVKQDDGTYRHEGAALEFVKRFPDREELHNEIVGMLQRRRRTSISFPRTTSTPELEWLSKTIKDINFGLLEDFPLPSRVEVSIPMSMPILGTQALNIRLIDTRGIDEPSAHRDDLHAYLDDDRAILVLCSRFDDAPSAAIQALIEQATQIELRNKLLERGLLLVLPRGGEEAKMLDMMGEKVADTEEGRAIRKDQVQTSTLIDLDMEKLPIEFMDVDNGDLDDCGRIKETILQHVLSVRRRTEKQVDTLIDTVERLIWDKDKLSLRADFNVATRPLVRWCENNEKLADSDRRIDEALLEAMAQVNVQSLRKSVKCRGDWHKFAYWPSLGFGARRRTVGRSRQQLEKLKMFVREFIDDPKLEATHDFLGHFLTQIDREADAFFIAVQQMCQTAFEKQLENDDAYWQWCEDRWPGTGYRKDVRLWTERWFDSTERKARHEFVESQIQRRWKEMVATLAEQLSSVGEDASLPLVASM